MRFELPGFSPIGGLLITSAPPTSASSAEPPSMPAAAKAAIMLVEQASAAEKAGTVGSSPASSQISRPILLQPRLGMTVPQTNRSGRAFAAIASDQRDRKADRVMVGKRATAAPEGVRRPGATKIFRAKRGMANLRIRAQASGGQDSFALHVGIDGPIVYRPKDEIGGGLLSLPAANDARLS